MQRATITPEQVGTYQQPKESQQQTVSPELRARTAKLWVMMAQMFGDKWTRDYGMTDHEDFWSKRLCRFSGEDIARGMRAVEASGEKWPPSLPEFAAMCKPPRRLPTVKAANHLLLTNEKAQSAVHQSEVAKMRALVGR